MAFQNLDKECHRNQVAHWYSYRRGNRISDNSAKFALQESSTIPGALDAGKSYSGHVPVAFGVI